jgi:hypothetical protein
LNAILPDPHDAVTVAMGWNDLHGGRVGKRLFAVQKMVEQLPRFSRAHAELLAKVWGLAEKAASANMRNVLSDGTAAQIRALLMPPDGDGKDSE